MTHASTEQAKYVPWFAKAGAACSIVPIGRFVNDHIFALKGGGYGCLFALSGVDEEGLTDQELESQLRMIEGALRGLPEGSALYQYARVRSGYDLPRQQSYSNPVTHAFVCDRLEFLEHTAAFRRIDLHWCLTLEPSRVKAFDRRPQENAAATSRMLAELEKTATLLAGNLGSTVGLRLLDKQGAFQLFSYLFNLEDWAEWGCLRSDTGVDRQVVQNPVSWESDHLHIGRRYVQMYSLKTTPEASRPCLFADLLKLDCDSILCSTWRPKSMATARHEIDQQEKFISFFKVGVLSRVMAGRDTASLDTGAGAKAANNAVDDLGEVIRSLDKKSQGEYSLRLLVAARSVAALHALSPAVHRVFVEARAQIMEETLGNLSAFYAMFPGNRRFNVFPMWLAEDHHARLSSIFAPSLGHPYSDDLDAEYLNVSRLCATKMRGVMSEIDLDELRSELSDFAEPEKKGGRSPREERIIAGFEEIQRFVEKHGRLPRHGEGLEIFERMYAVRLDRLRALEECRSLLTSLDHQGLLTGEEISGCSSEGGADEEDLLAELTEFASPGSVTELRHVRKSVDKRAAGEVATRAVCVDFETFKPLFEKVQRELESGIRKSIPVQTMDQIKMAEIQEGQFFIVGGQLAYVAEVGAGFKTDYDRRDSRLRVIYDNGTESNILMRSFQRSLYPDKEQAGRIITSPDAGPLFASEQDEGDSASGTIYVLRSKSDHPIVAANRKVLHKIGVTGGKIETRVANASLDPTFLMADVEVVATYQLFNINRVKLENIIHRVFGPAQMDIEIQDRFGNLVKPREWFLVPHFVVDEAVERIKDGTIPEFVYDPATAHLVRV